MNIKQEIANDLFKDKGALLDIFDIMEYTNMKRDWCSNVLRKAGVRPIGQATGKRYFYKEVAEAIVNYR